MDTKLLTVWTALMTDTGVWSPNLPQEDTLSSETELLVTGTISQPGIAFSIPASNHVVIEIFDMLGRKISSLIDGYYGSGEFRFGVPQSVGNGPYLVRMTTEDGVYVAKLNVAR